MPTRPDPVPPNSILAAVDGSPAGEAAADFAVRIARSEGLSICGAYVIEETLVLDPYASYAAEIGDTEPLPTRNDLLVKLEHRGEETLARLVERCRAAGVGVSTRVVLGGVPPTILKQAAGAAFLALGRSGARHGGKAGALGGHFRRIARHSPCPLLVGTVEHQELRRLLVAYDGTPSARSALDWAVRLRHALDAEVLLVNVRAETEPADERLAAEATDRFPAADRARVRFATRHGSAVAAILSAAAEDRSDAILIGRYRHGTAVEWLVGSTLDGVLKQAAVPVLIA